MHNATREAEGQLDLLQPIGFGPESDPAPSEEEQKVYRNILDIVNRAFSIPVPMSSEERFRRLADFVQQYRQAALAAGFTPDEDDYEKALRSYLSGAVASLISERLAGVLNEPLRFSRGALMFKRVR